MAPAGAFDQRAGQRRGAEHEASGRVAKGLCGAGHQDSGPHPRPNVVNPSPGFVDASGHKSVMIIRLHAAYMPLTCRLSAA